MKKSLILFALILMSQCVVNKHWQNNEYQSVKIIYDNGDVLRELPKTEDLKRWSKNYAQNSLSSILVEHKDSVKMIAHLIYENLPSLRDSCQRFDFSTTDIRIPTDSVDLIFSANTSNDINTRIMVVLEEKNALKNDSLFLDFRHDPYMRFNNCIIPSNEIIWNGIIKLIAHRDSMESF